MEGCEAGGGDCAVDALACPTEEEMLQWCQGLDFDSYSDAWAVTALTLGSEAFVPVDEAACLPQIPPYGAAAPRMLDGVGGGAVQHVGWVAPSWAGAEHVSVQA